MIRLFPKICILVLAFAAFTACGREAEDTVVVDLDRLVRSVREESDRRRPEYRELVERLYPAIAGKWAGDWSADWAQHRLRPSD